MSRVRSLAKPAFPDDDGAVDADVRAATQEYARTGRLAGVLAALTRTRVIVPVVALPARGEPGAAKEGDMAAVLMTGADGRTALLAFSGLDPMRSWDPQARPVAVSMFDAARAARSEGASAIVLDVAGPVRVVVEAEDLTHLADGERLVRTPHGYGWTRGIG